MAKRKTTTTTVESSTAELPPGVEYVTVEVPVYRGTLERPRLHRIEARFDTREESEVVQRMYHAMTLLNRDSRYPTSYNLTFRSLLRGIAEAIK